MGINMKNLLIIPMMLSLTGCALLNPPVTHTKYVRVGNDPAMVELNKIAENAERNSHVLSEIQAARAESNITLQGARAASMAMGATPSGWGKITNVSYQGPFNKLVKSLATRAGYEYYTQGSRPANVPLVTINAVNKSLKSILNDVVSQLPDFIGVSMYPRTRSIIVNFHDGRG